MGKSVINLFMFGRFSGKAQGKANAESIAEKYSNIA